MGKVDTLKAEYCQLQNAAQHEKHAVFDGTVHFPKFLFVSILQFIRLFEIGIYTLLSSIIHEQFIWRIRFLKYHIYLNLAYALFVPSFSYFGKYG